MTASECAAASEVRCPGCRSVSHEPRVLLRGRDRLMGGPGEFAVVACGGCGLAFTEPRLSPSDFETYYPDAYSAHASGRRTLVDSLRHEAIARFGPYRRIWRMAPGRLLDVGCGTGELAAVFARHGWQVSAVEPSARAADRARAAGIDVVTGTIADAPWAPGTFDAIIFNHSLEHIDDPLAALEQAARLLRRGGLVAVAVPNFGSWHRRAFGSAWFQLDLPRHLQHFDRSSLVGLARCAGLHPVAIGADSMRASPLGSLQYAAFGRLRIRGRAFRILCWATAPLLALADRVGQGDCLHLIARR